MWLRFGSKRMSDEVTDAILCHLDAYGTVDEDGVTLFDSVEVLLAAFGSLTDVINCDAPTCARKLRSAVQKALLHQTSPGTACPSEFIWLSQVGKGLGLET